MKLVSSDSNLFQTNQKKKKSEQNRTLILSKSSEHNFTLKPSVKQLASEEKFTRQECGGTQGVFVFSIFFFFSLFHLARIKYFVFLFHMHQHATMGLYYFIHR